MSGLNQTVIYAADYLSFQIVTTAVFYCSMIQYI